MELISELRRDFQDFSREIQDQMKDFQDFRLEIQDQIGDLQDFKRSTEKEMMLLKADNRDLHTSVNGITSQQESENKTACKYIGSQKHIERFFLQFNRINSKNL